MQPIMQVDLNPAPPDSSPAFFVTGGTLPGNAASYVERQADRDLFTALMRGEFCFVLNTRQMGKSSLMIRMAARLRESGVTVAVLDLTAIGQNLTPEQWYNGLLNRIGRQLDIEDELEDFFLDHERLGPLQRFMAALPKIILPRVPNRLVLFVDEIDAVRSLPFSADEFFAGIRECYNRRTQEPEFARLAFCLLGVATPADLISDTRLSPFNIGTRIELRDFTPEEAAPLAQALGGRREEDKRRKEEETGNREQEIGEAQSAIGNRNILNRILYWTGGHPYMTQRLCRALVEREDSDKPVTSAQVDKICTELFLSHQARETDDNLAFVRTRLLRSEADLAALLDLYLHVRNGSRVKDDETNPLCGILRLSGVVKVEKGLLKGRNRIYDRVFDRDWIITHTPDAELRRQRAAYRKGLTRALALSSVVLMVMGFLAGAALMEKRHADAEALHAEAEAKKATQYAAQEKILAKTAQDSLELVKQEKQKVQNQMRLVQTSETHATQSEQEAEKQAKLAKANADAATKEAIRANQLAKQRAALLGLANNAQQSATREKNKAITYAQNEANERQRAERLLYPNLIARADRALTQGGLAQAQMYLARFNPLPKAGISAAANPKTEDLRGFEWRYLERQCRDTSLRTLHGHHNAIRAVAYAPDGSLFASADTNHSIRLWKAADGQEAGLIDLGTRDAECLCFSADSRTLLAATPGRVRCFSALNGQEQASLQAINADGHYVEALCLAVSPDGKRLACGCRDGSIIVYDLAARRTQTIFTVQEARDPKVHYAVNGIAFSPDGRLVAAACGDYTGANSAKLCNLNTGSTTTLPLQPSGYGWPRMYSAAFSPDGKLLAMGGEDQWIHVWNTRSFEAAPRHLASHRDKVNAIRFSTDGQWMATAGNDGVVKLWGASQTKNEDLPREVGTMYGHARGVSDAAFAPGGKILLSGSVDTTLKTWDVAAASRAIPAPGAFVGTLAFFPDNRRLATGRIRGDNRALVWDTKTHRELTRAPYHPTLDNSDPGGAWTALSPDGKVLAIAATDRTLTLCSVETGLEIARFPGAQEPFDAIAFSPDGKYIATGGRGAGYHPRLWDVKTCREIPEFAAHQGHEGWVLSLAFSPDSKTLVSGGGAGEVRWWDIATRKEIGSPPKRIQGKFVEGQFKQQNNIFALAFSPDGKWLVTGSEDNTAWLWDAHTRKPIQLLAGHADIVWSAAFSRDSKTVVTGSKDGTIKFWSLSTLRDGQIQEALTLPGDGSGVYSLAFSPDGNTLASGHTNGTVLLWQTK